MEQVEYRKEVIREFLLKRLEYQDVKFTPYYVDVLTTEPRGDGGSAPWWKHLGTINSVYMTLNVD